MSRPIVPIAALVVAALVTGCGAQRQHRQMQQQGEELRFELAALYVQRGALQAAAPLLQRVIAETPRDPAARVLYGTVLRDLALYPQAEKELRFAIRLDDQRADARGALAVLLDLTRRSAEALTHHHAAVVLAPGDARLRNNYGFSLYLAGRTDEAITHLERALALDPGLAQAHLNLGFAYGRAGRLADAERAFRSAVPEAVALHDLALVHDERGEHERASLLRAQASAIDPDLGRENGATAP
jgi:tetratricopeptide (TPR) repeat protein